MMSSLEKETKKEIDRLEKMIKKIDEFKEQGITEATCGFLESHAYSVNDMIKSSEIRNLHVLYNEQ